MENLPIFRYRIGDANIWKIVCEFCRYKIGAKKTNKTFPIQTFEKFAKKKVLIFQQIHNNLHLSKVNALAPKYF